MSVTRVVRFRPGLRRDPGRNVQTQFGILPLPKGPPDARVLFEAKYAGIKDAWSRYDKQGVAVFAFDRHDAPIGELWIEASLDRPRAAVVGRHSMCDLMLPGEHVAVSLRHLVVMASAISHDEVRVRVIDLCTGEGFVDEAARTLRAVASDGPLFLRMATVDLMFLPTPEVGGLPAHAHEAYACLPERIFLDEVEGGADARPRRVLNAPAKVDLEQTAVRAKGGPVVEARDLCLESETQEFTLTLRSGGVVTRRPVGPTALDRGILVGRYSRCDLGAMQEAEESELSRVHVLIVRDGDRVVAIDTASTNGTLVGGRLRRIVTLQDGDVIGLASDFDMVWNS